MEVHEQQPGRAAADERPGGSTGGLVVGGMIAGLIYLLLSRSSMSGCVGGYRADGSFADFLGNAVERAPQCVSVTFTPQPIVLLLLAAVTMAGIAWAARANGRNRRAELATVLLLCLVLTVFAGATYAYTAAGPIESWQQAGSFEPPPSWTGAEVTWSELPPPP